MKMRWHGGPLVLPLLLVCWWCVCSAGAGRVLALFQLNAKSHFLVYEPLLKELASRGHEVTVVSHFPQKTSLRNYKDASLQGLLPNIVNNISFSAVECGRFDLAMMRLVVQYFWQFSVIACETTFQSEPLQQLLRSNQQFDIVVTEIFSVDCMAAMAHRFKAPLVSLQSSVPMHWAWDRMGNPDNPAYMPSYFSEFTDRMGFKERLLNTLLSTVYKFGFWYFQRDVDALCRKYVGEDTPPLADIVRNTSLLLVNSHVSLHPPTPLLPNIVNVAGMHLLPPKPLPEDLRAFVEGSPHGVVLFSFGSMMRSETMPKPLLDVFLTAFRALPQRVLWKTGRGAPPGLPPNVLASDWLPQSDLLHHPKMVAFLTHGGLLSVLEAVDAAVPMLGLPLHSDQHANLAAMERHGVARVMEHRTLTADALLEVLRDVVENPRYKENIRRLSALFKDRPRPPLEEAVYWTEYVMHHGGAPHLRSAAVDLQWWQLWLLDVIAAIVASFTLIVTAVVFSVGFLCRLCRRPAARKVKRS